MHNYVSEYKKSGLRLQTYRLPLYRKDNCGEMCLSLRWAALLCTGTLVYGSYSTFVHLCEVDGKIPFNSSSVVLMMEFGKFLVSAILLKASGCEVHFPSLSVCLPFALPAVLYFINNNLAVHMQLQMDPASYQVLSNLKIVSTAVLYRLIIKRNLSLNQWTSVGILTFAGFCNSYGGLQDKGEVKTAGDIHVTVIGLVMMLIYCTVSGLAGVVTEYILKKNIVMSIHYQNILLYMYGIIINFCSWFFQEVDLPESETQFHLFRGYSVYTWMIVITQVTNGLIMSVIMKHASNITRLFVVSSAMLVATGLSVTVFNTNINSYFLMSLILVLVALCLYHMDKK
ncbi:probable UDP-sugar transporter protein SLC35A4 [Mizuhopecten yessoensis]|uniref:UDP-sugar transporter protein SLC35A4 n=1 Tax=Mizuhopecten yessoensis TaxID=6573 RepID=A0A210QZF7_MIZYE|nr:probable UDP-sugar transporter protein SLC35A4 [Mizuhopecten yessoensis]OWF54134.1 UDP-sugar transporter protein SLC35A4 [Mizuhopecten yessoensis]